MRARFRPSPQATAVLAVLALLFTVLGCWQWQRASEKQDLVARFEDARALSVLPPGGAERFTRITLGGRFDPLRHVLVDNRVHAGRAGVHVLTPLQPTAGGKLLLVNRGWLRMPSDRRTLPDVPTSPGKLTVSGHLDDLRGPGATLGAPESLRGGPWPRLITYPDLDAIAAALGEAVYPQVLYLDAASPGGFEGRDWKATAVTPNRHRAYAVQWFALAATAMVAWVALGFRHATGSPA